VKGNETRERKNLTSTKQISQTHNNKNNFQQPPKMPIRASGMSPAMQGTIPDERNNWVNVSWMPHSCLSQTSHLYFSIRSVLTVIEDQFFHQPEEEWQVRATVNGVAGISLVPVATTTSTAPLLSIRDFLDSKEQHGMFDKDAEWLPLVSNVTHICKFDSVLNIPIRWRDLPRDACLVLEVLGYCDKVVSIFAFAPMSFSWSLI
jgi:hypothetical protein